MNAPVCRLNRIAAGILPLLMAVSCGKDQQPTTPTPPVQQTPVVVPQPPAPIPAASFEATGQPLLSCVTGFCSTLTATVVNVGPGCATAVNAVYRAYGNNGAPGAAQLGSDITMRANSQSLSSYVWKPGASLLLSSITGFTDVRSANTVFRLSETHTNVTCPP